MKNWEAPQGYVEKKYNYTYKLTFKNDERYYYYGVHCTNIDPEYDNYYGSGTKIKEMHKIYGKDCFNKEILEFFPTKKDALLAEDKLVPVELLNDEFCLNRIQGGGTFDTTGMKMNQAHRDSVSKRFKGKKRTPESIQKMIETRRKRGTDKHSEETRKKLSEIKKEMVAITNGKTTKFVKKEDVNNWLLNGWSFGYSESRNKKLSNSKMGEKNPMYHKAWSEESKKKMLETKYKNGTNFHSEKTKAILAEKNREKAKDPEFRRKLSEAGKGKNTWSKGRKRINKDGKTKAVLPEELQTYLNEGWQLGHGYKCRDRKSQ
jgi:hypothetical protein